MIVLEDVRGEGEERLDSGGPDRYSHVSVPNCARREHLSELAIESVFT